MRSPYGKLLSGTNERLPFGFKGYYGHLGGELHRAFARTYDAGLGAFTSWDTLAGDAYEPITMNRLRAFSGNPVGVDDWLGLADGPTIEGEEPDESDGGDGTGGGGSGGGIDRDVTKRKIADAMDRAGDKLGEMWHDVVCWLSSCPGGPSDFGALDVLGDGAGKLRLPDLGQSFSSGELLRWPGEPEPRLLAFNITGEDDLNAEQLNNLTRGVDILRRMAVDDSSEAQRARDLFGAWGHDLEVLTTPGLGPRLEVGGYEWLPETLRPAGAWVPFTGHKIVMPGYSLFNSPTSAAGMLMHELSHWGAVNSQRATPWHLFRDELDASLKDHRWDSLMGHPEGGIGQSLFGDWWEKPR